MKTSIICACVAALGIGLFVASLRAQDPTRADESAARTFKLLKAPATPSEYWDAVKFSLNVGRHEDAANFLDRLLSSNPPQDLLITIRERDSAAYFPKLAATPELQEKAIELVKLTEKAAQEHSRDPVRIQKFIDYLTRSSQHRAYAIAQLRTAGADAVPPLLSALQNPSLAEHHATILMSMQHLNGSAVPPLVAALETEDRSLLTDVLRILGELGDQDTVPHLRFIADAPGVPEAIQSVARSAVESILNANYTALATAHEALVAQAVRYYQHQVDLRANSLGKVRLWRWVPREGLNSEEVSASYAEEYFGLTHCRQALTLEPKYEPAQIVMLSLAMDKASERVGIDQSLPGVPRGAAAEALAAGPDLVGKVLVRALSEERPAVALAALRALARTGDMNLLASHSGQPSPLIQSLSAPDLRIQFAAAEAVLSLRPQTPPPGATRVISVLSRALTSSGSPKAMVIDPDGLRGSALASLFRELGYEAMFVADAREGFAAVAESADFELICLDPNIYRPELTPAIAAFRADARTAAVPIILLGEPGGEFADPLHESLRRGELTVTLQELQKLGEQIDASKLDPVEKEELAMKLARLADDLPKVAARINVLPPSRVFLSVLSGELDRFSREVALVKSDKSERESLISDIAKLDRRIRRLAEPQIERAVALRAREGLPTREALTKFERRYPRVKAFLRPMSVDMLKLQLDPLLAGLQSKPLTAAERAEYARRSASWLARIARGEIRGIELRPAEAAILSVVADDTIGPDAIVAASALPTAKAQSELARLILDNSASMPLRLEAAKQICHSLRQFGVLMSNEQVIALRDLLDETDESTFHHALAAVVGLTKPRPVETGERLRRFSTPGFDPSVEPAHDPAVDPAAPDPEPPARDPVQDNE